MFRATLCSSSGAQWDEHRFFYNMFIWILYMFRATLCSSSGAQWDEHSFFYNMFIWILYMFRATLCSSSGGQWDEHRVARNMWRNQINILTIICLTATTLSYDVAQRKVRSWRQNSFDWFSRWPWNTLRNRMCVAGRSGGEGGSFQLYFYNRYKIVVYTGLRSDCIKNHASRYRHRWR
jgi:hypothetical protein